MEHKFDPGQVADGLKLMLWGFFKKLVIADRLAIYVDQVFADPSAYQGLPLIIGGVFFHYQLYCDFSGYSDIAVGTAQTMGFKLNRNFTRPFLAKSMSEKWTRWHISLGMWIRDYLYLPLRESRCFRSRRNLLILTTWMIIGLWHGANWNFVAWGIIHGSFLIGSRLTKNIRKTVTAILGFNRVKPLHDLLRMVITFFMGVFAVIFFRSPSIHHAFIYLGNAFSGPFTTGSEIFLPGFGTYQFTVSILAICCLETVQVLQERCHNKYGIGLRDFLRARPIYLQWPAYMGLVLMTLYFNMFSTSEYIYFQF